ncbi:MAG: hypothetical protein MUE70_09205 [Desulfobacterales bacterium]|nr:hypothetical protein [Desulfobacterales bacterium]
MIKVKETLKNNTIEHLQSNDYKYDLYRQLGGKKSYSDIKKKGGHMHHLYIEELCHDLVKDQAMIAGTENFVRDYNKEHENLSISANLDEDELKDLLQEREIKKFTRINSTTVWKLNIFPLGLQLSGCRTGLIPDFVGTSGYRDSGRSNSGGIPTVHFGVSLNP